MVVVVQSLATIQTVSQSYTPKIPLFSVITVPPFTQAFCLAPGVILGLISVPSHLV